MDDLTSVMQVYKADYILTVLTSAIPKQTPLIVANKLAKNFPKAAILISGAQIFHMNIQLPSNVRFLYTIQELVDLLIYLRIK